VGVIFSEDFARIGGAEARWPALALVAAASVSASGSVALRRWGAGVPRLSLAAIPMLATGVLVGLLALAVERRAIELAPAPVLATLYLALFGSAVTFSLYFWLIERHSALAASLVSYTAPVVAVLVGTLGLREPLTWRVIAGGCLVLGGVAGVLGGTSGPAPPKETT
jgi:probable blue pigment (indigoidine) exporter